MLLNSLLLYSHDTFLSRFCVTQWNALSISLVDNCPDDANSDQADGDGDGYGNVCGMTEIICWSNLKDVHYFSDNNLTLV